MDARGEVVRRDADWSPAGIHAVGQPVSGQPCPVVIVVEYAETEPQVITPFELDVRVTLDGVAEYELIGENQRELVHVATP